MINLDKFRLPLGSLIVDAALVFSLIWWGATTTAQLDEISRRLEAVEQVEITPEASRRLSVVETRESEIYRRLERIEVKLDRLLEDQ